MAAMWNGAGLSLSGRKGQSRIGQSCHSDAPYLCRQVILERRFLAIHSILDKSAAYMPEVLTEKYFQHIQRRRVLQQALELGRKNYLPISKFDAFWSHMHESH
jgi:hypothetical protein